MVEIKLSFIIAISVIVLFLNLSIKDIKTRNIKEKPLIVFGLILMGALVAVEAGHSFSNKYFSLVFIMSLIFLMSGKFLSSDGPFISIAVISIYMIKFPDINGVLTFFFASLGLYWLIFLLLGKSDRDNMPFIPIGTLAFLMALF